jgi:simple sugar transport system permease protein
MLVSGAVAGIAGVGEIAGPLAQIFPNASPGYGYTAIIVAYLGRLNPLGILLSGLLMALLYLGGDLAQMSLGMPSSITGLLQSTLLFFLLTADVLVHHRIRFRTSGRKGVTA